MLLLDIVTVTSQDIKDTLFNATNITMFEARKIQKMEISQRL